MRRPVPAALALLACLSIVACFGDDEKPQPTFMSQPDGTAAPGSDAPPSSQDQANNAPPPQPAAPDSPRVPEHTLDAPTPPRGPDEPLIVIVGGEEVEVDFETEPEFADDEYEDDPSRDADDPAGEYAEEEPEASEEDEEDGVVTALLGGVPIRVPAPLPADDLPTVAAGTPSAEPTPSQLTRATRPWQPTLQSELDRLLARERAADLTPEQIEAMPDYFEIPAPPNPEAGTP